MRFLFVTDTHWTQHPAPAPGHPGVWQKELFDTHAHVLPAAFLRAAAREELDFIIHGGDLCRAATEEDWSFARSVLDQTGVSCHVIPGNHDTSQQSHRERFGEHFGLEGPKLYRAQRIGDLGFVFLDSTYLWRRDKVALTEPTDADYNARDVAGIGVNPAQLTFLEEQLRAWEDIPTIVVSHCPMIGKEGYPVKTRKERPIEMSLPECDPAWMTDIQGCWVMPLEQRRAEMLWLLRQYGNVKLVLSGHTHFASASVVDGVVHCTCSSLSAWPLEMRVIEVTNRELRVEPVPLGEEDLLSASHRPDWGNDWVRGMSDRDRHIKINLSERPERNCSRV